MMTSVPSEIVSRYSGELRKDGDHRESQILFEYDSTFNLLHKIATIHRMQIFDENLLPLFQCSELKN